MTLLPNIPNDTSEEVEQAERRMLRFYGRDCEHHFNDDVAAWTLARQYLRERAAKIERGKCKKGKKQ